MRKSINDIFDWAVIIVGCITLILALFGVDDEVDDDFLKWSIVISFVIVLYHLVRVFVLFLFMRPLFDWHLINGNFLRKISWGSLVYVLYDTVLLGHYIHTNYPHKPIPWENLCKLR